jgi:hypothetical protein
MTNNDAFKVVDDSGRAQGIAGLKFTLDIDNVNTGWAANAYRAGIDISGVMEFQVGPNQGADHRVSAAINDMGTNSLGISGLDISTQEASQNLVDSMRLDDAIATEVTLAPFRTDLNIQFRTYPFPRKTLHQLSPVSVTQIWPVK